MVDILAQKWKWFIGLGVVSLVLGCLALLDTVMVTITVVVALGIILIISGFSQIIHACYVREWKGFALSALAGIVYLIGGILLVKGPIIGSLVLTTFLAICFCFGGAMKIVLAYNQKQQAGWVFLVFSGILSIIVGLILIAQPVTGLWFIGFMIAFDLIFFGAAWIQLGYHLKQKLR